MYLLLYKSKFVFHLKSFIDGTIQDFGAISSFLGGKTFQNLSVSSPAPVTNVWPSGLHDKYRTLKVCPVNVASFFMVGYFQTNI